MQRTYLIIITILSLSLSLYAQKGSRNGHLEIIPSVSAKKSTVDKEYPTSLSDLSFSGKTSAPQSIAWQYLKENGHQLGIYDPENTLQHKKTRTMPSGYRVRFRQVHKSYPVYESGVVVSINTQNQVVFVANSYKPDIQDIGKPGVSQKDALASAKNHLSLTTEVKYLNNELVVFYNNGNPRLVHKISFITQDNNAGDWEFLVDAEKGQIIQAKDRGAYHSLVFDPDPITRSGADYGDTGFTDNNDSDSQQLNQQRVNKELHNLTFENGLYRLQNEYASIVDYESPVSGLYEQELAHFIFTRSEDGFEAVNVFYHISQSMAYINDTLGIELMPYQYSGGVRFDPHGLSGDDNAWYVKTVGYLSFGDGGVDSGEDPDVIVHELGHGLHDWFTYGEISQVDGLSEGSSDYWAQSYKRSKGFMDNGHPKYDWLGSWKGHNEFWAGRTTDYDATYPDGLVNQVHTDGQIWATALMKIYDQIGREATDINFLSALSMLNESSSQRDAAYAFIQSDKDNYDGSHLQVIGEVFKESGHLKNPLEIYVEADVTGGPANLAVHFNDISDGHSNWQWDLDGDGLIDSYDWNPVFTYSEPGLYTVKLSVFDGLETVSDSLVDFISVNDGIFIWEGLKDGPDNSGRYIYDFLKSYKTNVVYSRSRQLPGSLLGYDAVMLSFGAGKNKTAFNGRMKSIVEEYLLAGGKIYIEGADAISSYATDEDFLSLLGLSAVDDGNFFWRPIKNLTGQPGTIFEGITFQRSLQSENASIDRFEITTNGLQAFIESDYGCVAIQSEGMNNQKTLLFSYALAELLDEKIPNNRQEIIINILQYFEAKLPLIPRISAERYSGHAPLKIHFNNHSLFNQTGNIQWLWDFDNDGIYDSEQKFADFVFNIPGSYDVKLTAFNGKDSISVLEKDFINVFNGQSALEFDEGGNYVEVEAHPILNLSEKFTISFYIFPTKWGRFRNGSGYIFDKGPIKIYLGKVVGESQYNKLHIQFHHQDGLTTTITTPDSIIQLNKWQNLYVSYNSDWNEVVILRYIYGSQGEWWEQAYTVKGPVLDNGQTGIMLANSFNKDKPFTGKMDLIKIYDIHRGWRTDGDELIARWDFNEGYGDTLRDSQRYHINGKITNPNWVRGEIYSFTPLAIDLDDERTINTFKLYPNFPNPFNPQTQIIFQTPEQEHVMLTIYDIIGRKVKILVNKKMNAGQHTAEFDGTELSSGIYFYKLTAGSFTQTRKMILLK